MASSANIGKPSGPDKNDPIKIETTTLKLNIKTTGDFITKEYDLIPFHPNMADMKDLSNNNYILFPSFVKITLLDLKNAGVGQDYRKVFTTMDKYIQLIKYVTSANRKPDNSLIVDTSKIKNYAITLDIAGLELNSDSNMRTVQKVEALSDEEIITNNIGLIKTVFFPRNSHFYVLNHEYVIGKNKYIPPYTSSGKNSHITAKEIPLVYNVTFELELLDVINNPDAGDFARLSCKAKRTSIKNDLRDMYGFSFEKEEKKTVLPSLLTPVVKLKRGFGPLQLEWEKRNEYKKKPETEKEREEMRKKMTPLEKKMEKYDKDNEEYNKIPNLLREEWKKIDEDYKADQKRLSELAKERTDLENKNKPVNSFITAQIDAIDKEVNELKAKGNLETQNREVAKKYIPADIIKQIEDKQKDLDIVKNNEKDLYATLATMTRSKDINLAQTKIDLSKVQADIRKKTADLEILTKKYGPKGEILVDTWLKTYNKIKSIRAEINQDKGVKEREENERNITIELTEKEGEIKAAREKLSLKLYVLNELDDITSKEKEEAAKQSKKNPIPIESKEELEKKITELNEEYMLIANKFETYDKTLQTRIDLESKEMTRYKTILSEQTDTYKKDQAEFDRIEKEITAIYNSYKTSSTPLPPTDANGLLVTSATEPKKIKDNQRITEYKNNQKPYTEKIEKINPKRIKSEIKFRIYEYYVKRLKKVISLSTTELKKEEVEKIVKQREGFETKMEEDLKKIKKEKSSGFITSEVDFLKALNATLDEFKTEIKTAETTDNVKSTAGGGSNKNKTKRRCKCKRKKRKSHRHIKRRRVYKSKKLKKALKKKRYTIRKRLLQSRSRSRSRSHLRR